MMASFIDVEDRLDEQRLRMKMNALLCHMTASHAVQTQAAEQFTTADSLARESILSSRVVRGLNLCEVRPSLIPDAGMGVFAKVDIEEGDIVTCYPGDVVIAMPDTGKDVDVHTAYGPDCATIYGAHVPRSMHADVISPDDMDYALNINRRYAVVGLQALIDAADTNIVDGSYLGHMINDGAKIRGLGSFDLRFTVPAYIEETAAASNMIFSNVDGLHAVIKASRPVRAGEECLISYGPQYWISRLQRRTARFVAAVSSLF